MTFTAIKKLESHKYLNENKLLNSASAERGQFVAFKIDNKRLEIILFSFSE